MTSSDDKIRAAIDRYFEQNPTGSLTRGQIDSLVAIEPESKVAAWMWRMHAWVITAHSKHRGIRTCVDVFPPPTHIKESPDFIDLTPLVPMKVGAT